MKFDKKSLLAALKPKVTALEIAGFGPVGIVQLTVGEVDLLRQTLKKEDKSEQFGLRLVLVSVVDAQGQRIFEEADLSDLLGASNAAMDALVSCTLEVNGFKKPADAKN